MQKYNPDILTCLANLSNDEVFTPPVLANKMLDLLPDAVWSDTKLRFLDSSTKTGVFLREIAKRLIKGLAKQIPDLHERINHIFTKHTPEMIKKISEVPEGKSLYGNYSDAWKKSPWDKPSCTVKENHGGVNLHPKLNRVLTPRELAALQSFPDDFIFKGNKKWQLVQIGNAVPPLLGKAIGLAVKKALDEKEK